MNRFILPKFIALLLPVMSALHIPTAMAAEPPPGRRIKLSVGQLFVPEAYKPLHGNIHLVLHLHGSAQVAEQNLTRSGYQAVLVTVVLPGLSRVYTEQFVKPETFQSILGEALKHLKELRVVATPQLSRVTVISFSAGFGGVRELLKTEEIYNRIDCLIMADSIHAGFTGKPQQRQVEPKHMSGFLRFARDAAAGKKVMLISHTQLKPETYASTTETTDYLLSQLGVTRETVQEEWGDDLKCISRCRQKGFQVYGFTGDTGPEHVKHLHNLWQLLLMV